MYLILTCYLYIAHSYILSNECGRIYTAKITLNFMSYPCMDLEGGVQVPLENSNLLNLHHKIPENRPWTTPNPTPIPLENPGMLF